MILRYSTDGGRSFGPPQVLSKALKAYAPDVAVARAGEFVMAWHEEHFPQVRTVVQTLRLTDR